jgi:protein-disulfide isomerase
MSIALATLVVACAAETSGPAEAEATSPVAARIGGEDITEAELDAFIKDQLLEQQTQGDPSALHELRVTQIENLIGRRLLDEEAARRGVSADEVLDQEAAARVTVSDEEIQAFFDQNQGRIQGDYAALAPQIRDYLSRQAGATAAREFVDELRAQAGVEVLLVTPRIQVASTGSAIGPVDAPVTIVEFSDYQCPYCQRAEPTVKQVLQQYEGQVRFVYKHFPLESIHPLARGASEAAGCAEDQGRFWDYHERVFAAANGLEPAALEGYATELELDLEAFRACVAERRHADKITTDLRDGQAAEVSSTPTFFVNGVKLKGAQPFSEFQRLIEAELAAAGASS